MYLDVDGASVYAATWNQEAGNQVAGAGPAVVFVHGAGMDHSVWQQQSRYLAHRGFSVFCVDLPGHGRSGGAPLASVEAMGDWIWRFADAAGVGQAALIGHSMGALAALAAAARAPERTFRLALLGVAARMPVHPELVEAARGGELRAAELIADWAHGADARRGGNVAPGIWRIGAAIRLIERAPAGALAADLAACDGYRSAAEAAAKVRCPTLLLLGAEDRMTPVRHAVPLLAALESGVQTVLPRSGHMPMVEAPRETLATLAAFLAPLKEAT